MEIPDRSFGQKRSASSEITSWMHGYTRRHPVAALETVGGQCVLGLRAIQYLVIDIATFRFPVAEFVRQTAFMASASAVPTLFVAIPIGVTLSIQFGLLAGQVGATSLAGAAQSPRGDQTGRSDGRCITHGIGSGIGDMR